MESRRRQIDGIKDGMIDRWNQGWRIDRWNQWKDGWNDRWIDGIKDGGWIDGIKDGRWIDGIKDGQIDGSNGIIGWRIDRWNQGWKEQIDGIKDGMDRQMESRMDDGQMESRME